MQKGSTQVLHFLIVSYVNTLIFLSLISSVNSIHILCLYFYWAGFLGVLYIIGNNFDLYILNTSF